jgi:hypothetical protein
MPKKKEKPRPPLAASAPPANTLAPGSGAAGPRRGSPPRPARSRVRRWCVSGAFVDDEYVGATVTKMRGPASSHRQLGAVPACSLGRPARTTGARPGALLTWVGRGAFPTTVPVGTATLVWLPVPTPGTLAVVGVACEPGDWGAAGD